MLASLLTVVSGEAWGGVVVGWRGWSGWVGGKGERGHKNGLFSIPSNFGGNLQHDCVRSPASPRPPRPPQPAPRAVSALSFSCHFNVLPIKASLAKPSQGGMLRVIWLALAVCAAIYATVAVSGERRRGEGGGGGGGGGRGQAVSKP